LFFCLAFDCKGKGEIVVCFGVVHFRFVRLEACSYVLLLAFSRVCMNEVFGRNLIPAWAAFFSGSHAIYLFRLMVFNYKVN